MFLHPVHSSPDGSIDEIDRYMKAFLDIRIATFTGLAAKEFTAKIKPRIITIFHHGMSSTVPCFFAVGDRQKGTRNALGGGDTSSSYRFYHPFVVIFLSTTSVTALERKYGDLLLPDSISLEREVFNTGSDSNPLTYIFERYVDLYESSNDKPFLERALHPYVPDTDSLAPSSIADAGERLELLVKMVQPFLRHFMQFMRTKDTLLVPGRIREVLVENAKDAATPPLRILTEDTNASLYINIPLRDWLTKEFLPLDQALYPLCYGITRLIAHGGSPSILFEVLTSTRGPGRPTHTAISARLGPYQRVYRVFLAYMLRRLDVLRKNGSILSRSSSREALASLDHAYGAPVGYDEISEFPFDAPLDTPQISLSSVGELIDYAIVSEEISLVLEH